MKYGISWIHCELSADIETFHLESAVLMRVDFSLRVILTIICLTNEDGEIE